MKRHLPSISPEFVELVRNALQIHAATIKGLQLALIATPDGFEIASMRNQTELQISRLSAMASSLMSMAGAVGCEIQSAPCKRLTFEAEGSTVVFQNIEAQLPCILCLVLDRDALLGQVFWAASRLSRDIAKG